MNLSAVCSLPKPVNSIAAGDVIYVPYFEDGCVYLRNQDGRITLIEHDTLKEALIESEPLRNFFTPDLIKQIESNLVKQQSKESQR